MNKDVAPYDIVGGHPAKRLKSRHDPETVAKLLAIAWWDWPGEKIDRHLPAMMSGDVNRFIEEAEADSSARD